MWYYMVMGGEGTTYQQREGGREGGRVGGREEGMEKERTKGGRGQLPDLRTPIKPHNRP